MPFGFRGGDRVRNRLSPSYGAVVGRERYYSLVAAVTVKILLLVFLLAFFGLMIRFLASGLTAVNYAYRYFLPALIVIVAIFLLIDIRKSIKGISDLRREMREKTR